MSKFVSTPSLGNDGFSNVLPGSVTDAINKAKTTASLPDGFFPWNDPDDAPRFFLPINIAGDRWDKLFPYRFVVIDTANGGRIVNGPNDNGSVIVVNAGTGGKASIVFENLTRQWSVQLPITPEQLNITDLFSITTSATLRGVIEEHNGVKFKTITASGTFGVWPSRQSIAAPPGTPSLMQSLFGGTLEAAGNLVNAANNVINVATNGHPASKPVTVGPKQSPEGLASTGYYQALFIQQFLEQYAEAKKRPENSGWRLVLDIPKQNQSFVVTPVQFVWQQTVNKPTQIFYNLQLKAWRRVDLGQNTVSRKPKVTPIESGVLQKILNTLSATRQLMSQSLNLIGAVRSDVETPLEVLRQTSMLLKDLSGVVLTAADLPFQLQKDFSSSIGDSLNTVNNINLFKISTSSGSQFAKTFHDLKSSYAKKEGLSLSAVSGGQLGNVAAQAQSIDPANNIFSNPEANHLLMDQVSVNSMVLNTAQQNAVDNAVEAARSITVDDLKKFRGTILQLALQLSNNFGSGSAYYNRVYGLPAPAVRATPITLDDYSLLQSLYDTLQSYDILTATTQIDDNNRQTNMDYVAGLASESDISFNVPNSKILAPVPFGLTVEAIAARYLGDPQRWLEIVTLNNLRDPYIDENGFQYPLLSNANGRQIIVGNNTNLYLGQRIILQSITQVPSARRVLGIDRLSDTSFLITLDGAPNLDSFLLSDKAYLQAYLPGTVNSQQKIFIPSDISVSNDPTIIVPASTSVDPLTGLSKVDLLLTDTGDLAVNNFGDFRFSYGMTNIIQALKIKMGTQAGSVLLHPDFGIGIRPGTINGSIDAQQMFSSINTLIQQDERFSGLSNLQISLNGPVLTIDMGVQLANQQGVFPITFQITS